MNAKRAFGLVFVALLIALLGATAARAWDEPFPIGPAAGNKYNTVAAMDAAGNMVVAWTQQLPNPVGENRTDLYAQRLDASGAPVDAPFRLNADTAGEQGQLALAMDADGNFVAVWASSGIHGRCFAADGAPRTDDFVVTGGPAWLPDVAMTADGRFVVVWADANDEDYLDDINARLYAADCRPRGNQFFVNNLDTGQEMSPAVAMDAAGNFTVAWVGHDSSGAGVFARRFTRNGAPRTGQFRVNQRQQMSQGGVDVAMDAAGNATFIWTSEIVSGSDYDVLMRRYNARGRAVAGEVRAHEPSSLEEFAMAVVARPTGELAVLWGTTDLYRLDEDLWVRFYNAQGKKTGPSQAVAQSVAYGYYEALATRGALPYLVVWAANDDTTDTQLYGRLLDSAGVVTTTFTPTNDAFTSSAGPNTVFNTRRLNVKNASQDYVTYLKFNVSSLTGAVQSARLRLWVVDTGYSAGGVFAVPPYYNGTTTQWLETGLTWNNAPTFSGSPLGSLGINPPLNQWIEVDVTPAVLTALAGDGRVSLAIPGNDSDVVAFSSKEGAHAPELVVATE